MTTKTIKTMLFASLIAAILLPTLGVSIAYAENENNMDEKVVDSYGLSETDKQELLAELKDTGIIHISPTVEQQKIIEQIEKIRSDSNGESMQDELDALRPSMIKAGVAFSEEFHANPEYWKQVLAEHGPISPLKSGEKASVSQTSATQTGTLHFIDAPITQVSSNDWYLVHRLYYSCSGGLVCDKGLWDYADDGDWSAVTITVTLSTGSYIRLEHEASNLHTYSVTRDFDSYWTHARGLTVLDSDTEFTTQYFTALEREIQDGLLETSSAQTNDTVYSTIQMNP